MRGRVVRFGGLSESTRRSTDAGHRLGDVADVVSHPIYREWASEALGDERQVYARSTLSSSDALVFLPDGAAEDFRETARRGELVCPVPGCPSPLLTTRGPAMRRHHFVHLQAPPDSEHQRAYVRRVATELLCDWIGSVHPRSTFETDIDLEGVDVTVLVTGPTGERFAVMFVDRRFGVDAWADAEYTLDRTGVSRGWIFAPRQFLRYPQPSTDATPDDPAILDRERGDIVLDRALFRTMRREGTWPLMLSIERREFGNLVPPDGVIAARLKLRPPASGDRVLHLVPAPIDKCRLGRDGIETPAVGRQVLAAPKLARARREREFAPPRVDHGPVLAPRWSAPEPETPRLRPVSAELRSAIDSCGPVTTMGTLISRLDMFEPAQEQALREQLNTLREEGVVQFERPLGRFSSIHLRRAGR